MHEQHELGDLSMLESILEEVRLSKTETGGSPAEAETPTRDWSMDEIDRLIAQTAGEDYVPRPRETAAKELDAALFTVAPLRPTAEMQDISSDSGLAEVDGQEKFEHYDEVSFENFELDTIVMPEDIPQPAEIKYGVPVRPKEPAPVPVPEEAPAAVAAPAEEPPSAAEIFQHAKTRVIKLDEKEHIREADYRDRFFSKLTLEDPGEIEVEPEGPVDKSGIVVAKAEQDAEESGLEPLPQVLSAEHAKELSDQKTRPIHIPPPVEKKKEAEQGDNVDGQIVLTGFDVPDDDTVPAQERESDVEGLLAERRKEKARNFHLESEIPFEGTEADFVSGAEERAKTQPKKARRERQRTEPQRRPVAREYNAPSERTAIHRMLVSRNNKATIGIAVAGGIQIVLLFLNIIPVLSRAASGAFAQNSVFLCVLNAILLIAAAAADSNRFLDGFSALIHLSPTSDSAVSLAIAIALVQNALATLAGGSGAGSAIFSVAAAFGVVVQKLTEKLDAMRILHNFEVCAYKYEHNMYAVHPLENESEIFELGRGLMMGNAELLYSSKVSFPTDFIRNSEAKTDEDRLARLLVPGVLIASIIIGVVAAILNRSIMTGLSALAGTFCLGTPIFAAFLPAFISRLQNRSLNREGAMIVNIPTAEAAAGANAVVLDAADIFDHDRCTMHGMKAFDKMRINSVLLYAAALMIKSGGPLRECFEHVIDGRQDLLPTVKEMNYEDKLGISARISGQPVLMGNYDLMVHHSVPVPDRSLEEKYTHSGRKVIYLAVDGDCVAMFVVSYAVDTALTPLFETLEDAGIQVLIRSNDVNITESLIARAFDLPGETFKILSSVSGKLFKRRKDAVCDKLPAGIVHDGATVSLLRTVAAACTMNSQARLAKLLQIVFAALGCILSAALFFTGVSFSGLTAFLALLLECAAACGILLLSRAR